MPKPKIVYFGSPEFSAEILKALLQMDFCQIVGVVTQPDKLLGRKQILTPSPVAQVASEHDLPIFKATKLDEANLAHLRLLKPDLFLVISYGKIIPQNYLDLPATGTLNVHFSLLPKYRGALCLSEAIRNQDSETGITLMVMDRDLDHGPILTQIKTRIDIDDNVASLTKKLTPLAIEMLKNDLPLYLAKQLTATPQDESQAIYTPLTKTRTHQDAFLAFGHLKLALLGQNAAAMHALIRSLNPEPGAWSTHDQTDFKILETKLEDDKLVIETVQVAGKNPISWKQFLTGHPL